jgi:prepilin-type N-terminal cleavage/methylation domain-containing protein
VNFRDPRTSGRAGRAFRARLRFLSDERGLTLIELLVASAMGVIVFSGAVMMFMGTVKSQPALSNRSFQIGTTRDALERMVRELRQGLVVDTATPSQLAFLTYVGTTCAGATSATKTLCEVTYTCSGTICTRTLANPNGTAPGTAATVIRGINNPASVFTYSGNPTNYVAVKFVLPTKDTRGALTLQDGASMRNATLDL